MSDERVFEPQIRALLVTTAHLCTVLFLKLTQVLSCYDHCTFVPGCFEFVPGGFTCAPGMFLTRFRRAPLLGSCGCFVCRSEAEVGLKTCECEVASHTTGNGGISGHIMFEFPLPNLSELAYVHTVLPTVGRSRNFSNETTKACTLNPKP